MAEITPKELKLIEDKFFDARMNTSLGFAKLMEKYGESGRDDVTGDISMRILQESNDGLAVYSHSFTKRHEKTTDYDHARNIHEEKHLTWYHIGDDAITKKLYGVDSDFIDIV